MPGRVHPIATGMVLPPDALATNVGNKAFNLMRLASLGFAVPSGFVLSTDFCRDWIDRGGRLPENLPELLGNEVRRIENGIGLVFGDRKRPLLLAVRSGAAESMPGMLDTLLNVGLSDRTLPGFIAVTGNPRLAWDSYRRLILAFAETVHGCPVEPFRAVLEATLRKAGAAVSGELDTLMLRELTRSYLHVYAEAVGESFPQAAEDQLLAAVAAVFRSWESARAKAYRQMHGLDERAGTAVTVQRMVFGNAGSASGAGVGFTRDPATGEKRLYLDFALNAQGEDVVSGRESLAGAERLDELMPEIHRRIQQMARRLERGFADAQDFEFTIEEGQLFLLQTRNAKRTPWAALHIAVALAEEGLIEPAEALARVGQIDLDHLRRRRLADPSAVPLATAVPASFGVAAGRIALSSATAERWAAEGQSTVLVREDIATDDIAGIAAARGVLTARGGRTSHAAVVARQLDRVCLVGCGALVLRPDGRGCRIGERDLAEGNLITLDAETGRIYAGALDMVEERPEAALATLATWRSAAAS